MVGGRPRRPQPLREIPSDRFPNLATVVAREIITKADIIAANPRLGRVLDNQKSLRQVVLHVLNAAYVFQYRYDGNRLVILRVFHSRESR